MMNGSISVYFLKGQVVRGHGKSHRSHGSQRAQFSFGDHMCPQRQRPVTVTRKAIVSGKLSENIDLEVLVSFSD
jgi:hypothetical protein